MRDIFFSIRSEILLMQLVMALPQSTVRGSSRLCINLSIHLQPLCSLECWSLSQLSRAANSSQGSILEEQPFTLTFSYRQFSIVFTYTTNVHVFGLKE